MTWVAKVVDALKRLLPLQVLLLESKVVEATVMDEPILKVVPLIEPSVPVKRLVPTDVVATILPLLSVERRTPERPAPVRLVLPEIVRLVVEAPPFKNVTPVKVDDACETRPLWKIWSAVQVYPVVGENGVPPVTQTPATAKQPELMLMPPP